LSFIIIFTMSLSFSFSFGFLFPVLVFVVVACTTFYVFIHLCVYCLCPCSSWEGGGLILLCVLYFDFSLNTINVVFALVKDADRRQSTDVREAAHKTGIYWAAVSVEISLFVVLRIGLKARGGCGERVARSVSRYKPKSSVRVSLKSSQCLCCFFCCRWLCIIVQCGTE